MVCILDWITACILNVCISCKTVSTFHKVVKQIGDKSLQFGPPIMLLFSDLESPLCLYVCNKLWYGIESIGRSHSASSQLSGEFMLLHSIHTLPNLALKEQCLPRTSPHVTVKNIYSKCEFRTSACCSKMLIVKSILNAVKIFRAICFSGQAQSCSKILNGKKILRENSVF